MEFLKVHWPPACTPYPLLASPVIATDMWLDVFGRRPRGQFIQVHYLRPVPLVEDVIDEVRADEPTPASDQHVLGLMILNVLLEFTVPRSHQARISVSGGRSNCVGGEGSEIVGDWEWCEALRSLRNL